MADTRDDLSLQEHLDLLGTSAHHLAFCCKVPDAVMSRALNGQPITRPHAEAIARELSEQHGLRHQVGFSPQDIKGLQVYSPPDKNTAEPTNPHRERLLGK